MNYTTLATADIVSKTSEALKARNFQPLTVETGAEALEKIKELIPHGASVMNGSSTTLNQIGFTEYLKSGAHEWNNLHEAVLKETDPAAQALARKHATVSDYYIGSVHALSETGEMVIASATGSQMPGIVHNASNIIFVVSTQKIMPTLADALARLREHVVPLEDARMKHAGYPGTLLSKILILEHEHPMMQRNVTVLFVNELLGF